MRFLLVYFTLTSGLSAFSAPIKKAPTLPPPDVDKNYVEFTGRAESAVDVIRRHRKNSACRTQLTNAIKIYKRTKAELHDLVAKGGDAAAIDKAEQNMRRARKPMLQKIELCGPCITHEVKKPIVLPGNRVWWVSDGSCQFEGDAAALRTAYDTISKSLKHLPEYSKHAIDPVIDKDDGGFFNVLRFIAIDPSRGEPLPKKEFLDVPPVYANIVVRGMPIRRFETFTYYFRNDWETLTGAGGAEALYFTFNKKNGHDIAEDGDSPRAHPDMKVNLSALPVTDITAAGTKSRQFTPWPLARVMGAWYVTSSGYYRYFTAADFGPIGAFPIVIAGYAREVMLDTLVQTYERAQELL